MTLLELALLIGACVSIIGVMLLSAHVVELEHRIKDIEDERPAAPYKLERPERWDMTTRGPQ